MLLVLIAISLGSALAGAGVVWVVQRGARMAMYRSLALQRRTLVELGQMSLAGDNMELVSRVAFERVAKAVKADCIVWLACEAEECRITSFFGPGMREGDAWPRVAPIPALFAKPGLHELDLRSADPVSREFYERKGYAYCAAANVLIGKEDGCLLILFKRKPSLTPHDRDFLRALAGTLSYALQRNYYEEELRLIKQRQEAALASLEAGIWEMDLVENVLTFDGVLAEQLGLGVHKVAMPAETFPGVHPDDQESVRVFFENHLKGGSPRFVSEHRSRLADGTYEWFHVSGKVVERDRAGRPLRAIGSQVNIDARKRVEEMLHTVNYTLETLLRISPIAIVALKEDLKPVLWNPAADQVLGTNQRAPFVQDLLTAIRSSPPLDGALRQVKADGAVRYLKIWSNLGHGTQLIMALDATEEVTSAEERKKLESMLINRQKLEAIGTLASGVAHEINNPLTSIINFGQLILDRLPPADPLRRFADGIVKEGLRISAIVRDLLSFSRPDEDQEERFDVRSMLESVLGFLAQNLRKTRSSVRLDVPEGLCARGRVRQLQQVILNLVNNAAYALNTRYPGYDEAKVIEIKASVCSDSQGRWVRISVKDFGPGIPAEVLPRIFDPFFTTKPRDVGTGLGLSISYDIVRKHGGRLTAESELGNYASFILDLPDAN